MPKKNFYAVREGRGGAAIYSSWNECKAVVDGHPGAKFQGFATKPEADAYLAGSAAPPPGSAAPPSTSAAPPLSSANKRPKPSPGETGNAFSTLMAARPNAAGGVTPDELAVFTDGACQGNQNVAARANPAGWGAVVVDGCVGKPPLGGSAVAELYGPVELNPGSAHYLGAEVGSNNTGELTAVCEALRWLAEHEHSTRAAVICYDSEYAANQAQGIHQAHKNKQLSQRSKQLLAAARQRRAVRFLHVKGHSNHVWNDAADALANRGATGQRSAPGGDAPGRPGVPAAPAAQPQPQAQPPPPLPPPPPTGDAASAFDDLSDEALLAAMPDAALGGAGTGTGAAADGGGGRKRPLEA